MISLPREDRINEHNLVEMLRLAFLKIAEMNDGSIVRDVELRQEVHELREDTRKGFQSVRQEIQGVREELQEQIGGLRQEMKEEIGGLRQEMSFALGQQTELLKQLVENTKRR